jgi:hypothetical protein
MGWRPWELERVAHPRDFHEAVLGFQWRLDRDLDCAAYVAYHALIAFGGAKKQDGTSLQLSEMLGRDLFPPFIPPRELDEATQEELAFDASLREAQAERSKLMIYAAQKAAEARRRGEDSGPWRA